MMSDVSITEDIVDRENRYMPSFTKIPYSKSVLKSGQGIMLEDYSGKRYIDFLSSASSANLGHNNSRVIEAVTRQMQQLANYTSAYFYSEPVGRLAERLSQLAPGDSPKKVAFGMSGSDGIDGMMKIARGYTERSRLVSFIGAYHGSTLGAISLSAITPNMKRKLGPLIPEVSHFNYPACFRCPYGQVEASCKLECIEAIRTAFETYLPPDEVAAVVLESIAGDAGLIVPPKAFVQALHSLCREHGILFAVDEVQQALGRTGRWFSIEHFEVEPDIMVMGKSLGGGLPLSAIIGKAEIMDSLESPAHLFTMSGNPTTASAALAQLDQIESEGILEHASAMGDLAQRRLSAMKERHPFIGDVRGLGLSIGVDLVVSKEDRTPNTDAAIEICAQALEMGLLLIYVGKSTLRVQPPLIISEAEMNHAMDILEEIFGMYANGTIKAERDAIKGW